MSRSAAGPAAIVVALPWEAIPLAKHLGLRRDGVHDGVTRYRGGDRILLLQSGMGRHGASRACASLDQPALILSTGFCGGVGPEIGLGSIVIASQVVRERTAFPADPVLLETATRTLKALGVPFHVGILRTVDEVVTPARTAQGPQDPHVVAVDMESAYVADAARRLGIPFLAIRVVSDTPAEPWAAHGKMFLEADGRFNPVRLLASLLRHPSWIPRMGRLAVTLRRATRHLAQGIAAILRDRSNRLSPVWPQQ